MITAKVKAGDYFYTSWGYDQTNIDFVVVVKVSPSGKTALCRMAHGVDLDPTGQTHGLTPGEPYGLTFKLVVRDDGCLRGSYPYCKGSKRRDTFLPATFGQRYYETDSMFGH